MEGELPSVDCDEESAAPRVLIVADNASELFGGEAALPLRYFRLLRDRGIPTYLLTHARVRKELQSKLPNDLDRIFFVEDTNWHRFLWRLGSRLETRLQHLTTGFALRISTQISQRRTARRLVRKLAINVVHQPTPVSPREPSFMYSLGAPVVIGPMNGNMSYPPALKHEEPLVTRLALNVGRASSGVLNALFPGKKRAATLLVANERTRKALGGVGQSRIRYLPENAVDTTIWKATEPRRRRSGVCRFIFVGRLIRSKGVDLWLRAIEQISQRDIAVAATVIGDGPEKASLEEQARTMALLATEMGEVGKVWFAGHREQAEIAKLFAIHDCLVLPTLIESGGAVLLEAMIMGLPVVSTDWGGPADYVDESCGILVPLDSRDQLVGELAEAMERLATFPELRKQMGKAGRRKVQQEYTWAAKIDKIIEVYDEAVAGHRPVATLRS